ncbi:hypothetical protein TraAM80_04654 [Trypanosoma rangeli]|uniref:Uncharacterized protein n=1 Tax=Trypanosoma rangeli TaxID=5698 RepID=A0A422NIX4_TRYRA|nr:uncharacterized protein TraAM80_04654 [Trypanosoma rangeli]RNF05344.1 hypothetical protein TraAM80_04654 [Trypanosoma rangeli]|eukprot:RNF05344.1 hypothetical protein TraAM80_04654 [Trypanosoma rangeli]
MMPESGWRESDSHLFGSPASQRIGREASNAFFETDHKTDAPHVRGRIPDRGVFDAVASPSAAAAAPFGPTRPSGGSPPRVQMSHGDGGIKTLVTTSNVTGQVLAQTAPPRALDDVDVSPTLFGTHDLRNGLLDQKLQHMQRETNALREELKETSGRLAHVTVKLNEQKVEFSGLTHRYGTTVEKLTAAESNVKRLEEHIVQERSKNGVLREERDKLKASLKDLEWEVEKLRWELQEERKRPAMDPREVQRMLDDRTRYVPAAEVQQQCEAMREKHQTLLGRFMSSLDALLVQHEEEETSVFVARSAVLSAATDLETRVASAETTLSVLCEQLTLFNEGSERDMTEMLTTLMLENKELWQHLSKLKGDHDTAVVRLATLRRKGEHVPQDQYDYAQKQLALTAEKLSTAQRTVEAQIELAREHEDHMKVLLNANDSLQDQLRRLTEELAQVKEDAERKENLLEKNRAEVNEVLRRAEEFQENVEGERRRLNKTIEQMNESFVSREQEYEQRIRQLQEERNATQRDLEQAQRGLDDTQQRAESLQRELDSRTSYFEEYRRQTEEHQQEVSRSFQEEMASARALLEQELSLTRRELEDQRTAARELERERDDEQAEHRAAHAIAAGLEAELSQQRRENEQQRRRLEEVTARVHKLEAEADKLRQASDTVGEESHQLQREVKRYQARAQELEQQMQQERDAHTQQSMQLRHEMREVEQRRSTMQEELQKIRLRLVEMERDQKQRVMRERTDADRESFVRENARLHEQYQEVQQENVALRESLQQLKGKVLNHEQLSQQLEDVQERLRQLPTLRQAAEDARIEAMRASQETETLRQERDAMAAKLDFFLEESKQAAKKDEEWGRIFRDAAEQTRRLSGQVSVVRKQQQSQRSPPIFVSPHPSGYSEQYSNYQRVLGNGGDISLRKPMSPSQAAADASPPPIAPSLSRPWH